MLEQCWNKPIRQVRNEIGKMSCLPIVLVLCNFWIVAIAVSLRQKQAQHTPSTGASWNGGTADIYNSLQVVVVIETWEGSVPYYPFLQYHNLKYHKAPPNSECYFIDFHSNFNFTTTLDRVGLGMSTGPRLQKQSLELARRHWEGLAHEKTDTKGDGEMEWYGDNVFPWLQEVGHNIGAGNTLPLKETMLGAKGVWKLKVFFHSRRFTWNLKMIFISDCRISGCHRFQLYVLEGTKSDCIEPRCNPDLLPQDTPLGHLFNVRTIDPYFNFGTSSSLKGPEWGLADRDGLHQCVEGFNDSLRPVDLE